jgi:hypothetical protein
VGVVFLGIGLEGYFARQEKLRKAAAIHTPVHIQTMDKSPKKARTPRAKKQPQVLPETALSPAHHPVLETLKETSPRRRSPRFQSTPKGH